MLTPEQKDLLENWKKELSKTSISYSYSEDGSNTDSMDLEEWDGGSLYDEIRALIDSLLAAQRAKDAEIAMNTPLCNNCSEHIIAHKILSQPL